MAHDLQSSTREAVTPGTSTATSSPAPGKQSMAAQAYAGFVQRKESGAAPTADVHAAAARGTADAGGPLPHLDAIQRAFGRHDVSGVQAHTGGAAQEASAAMGAQAFATGNHVAFGGAPDLHTAAHEAAHVVQQRAGVHLKGGVGAAGDAYEQHADAVADKVVAGQSAEGLLGQMAGGGAHDGVQRKEVETEAEIHGPQDWTRQDRESNSARWQAACLRNVREADSAQYVKVVERRDFYHWFYEYSVEHKFTTRWALAAWVVANGAHQIADMDLEHATANETLGLANVELQGAMREGNQVIFDNVLPKLRDLLAGGALRGRPALDWDKQILSEEQTLVQPMYARMSPQTRQQLEYIARKQRFAGVGAWWTGEDKVAAGPYNNAGTVPGFNKPDMQNIDDRWQYGMELGDQFTPGGTGYKPGDPRPAPRPGYTDGSEFAKVDTRAHLHELDAWLNPNRISRSPGNSGSDIAPIIAGLTPFEKQQVLTDHSADGWAYSTQFGKFSIAEAQVAAALPADAAAAGAVAAFLGRYRAEYQRTQAEWQRLQNPLVIPF